jgi:paraquat-inducible protein B
MNNKTNPKTIGAFIIGALCLLITSIFVFSSDSWFSKNHRFIVVFTESINGLNIGAPIKLYGVQIGHVTEINVERDLQRNMTLIPVVFEVDQEKIGNYVDTKKKDWNYTEVDKLIDSGLRMQLQLGSLLTGQLFIEALFLPDTEAKLYGHKTSLKEIPSIPSKSDEIQKALRNVLEGTKTIDLTELFSNLQKTIANIEQITGSKQTESTLTALNSSMLDLQQILSTLNQDIKPLSKKLNITIDHADKLFVNMDDKINPLLEDSRQIVSAGKDTVQAVNSTLEDVKSLVNSNSPIIQGIQSTMEQLTRAARSTRTLVDYLERHPDALLFGKDSDREEK